ncbi:MAG: acyl-CoA dehydrogenase family protein [Halioglobus sp.]|nr:acyl-CoA dehydrogenase family protein [Halioglobus sp.]
MFEPSAFGLTDRQVELTALARQLGKTRFVDRTAKNDVAAAFPVENFNDLRDAGMLAICVPQEMGGLGADFKTYMMVGAEIGRYCGTTALTWNMHVCSCLWTGDLVDDLVLTDAQRAEHQRSREFHYGRIVNDGAIYSQPGSEANRAATGEILFSTKAEKVAGGWKVNGRKIFASLSGNANYYGVLCCEKKEKAQLRDTMYVAVPADAQGVSVVGEWDTLGMRGTDSRTLVFEDVFIPAEEQLMPLGVYQQAGMRWPHMFTVLTATYMGVAQAVYDFTVSYLRGEVPGMGVSKRRSSPLKQASVAEMRFRLEQTKALWYQMISEARVDPSKDQKLRAYATQYTVMENANEMAQMAIRVCGGHSLFRQFPLERLYRDSRCGALMLPWSVERCIELTGMEALYEPGETDD